MRTDRQGANSVRDRAGFTRMIGRLSRNRERAMRDNVHVADPTTEFFDGLGRREYEPLLRKSRGIVRFEIIDGKRTERRYVTVDRGNITVSGRGARAQAVIRADRVLFERMASGELNPIAAVLRGELGVEGAALREQ